MRLFQIHLRPKTIISIDRYTSHICFMANTWFIHHLPFLKSHFSLFTANLLPSYKSFNQQTTIQLANYSQQTNTSRVTAFTLSSYSSLVLFKGTIHTPRLSNCTNNIDSSLTNHSSLLYHLSSNTRLEVHPIMEHLLLSFHSQPKELLLLIFFFHSFSQRRHPKTVNYRWSPLSTSYITKE